MGDKTRTIRPLFRIAKVALPLLLGMFHIFDFIKGERLFYLWMGIAWMVLGLLNLLPQPKSKRQVMEERGALGLCPHCAHNLKGNLSRVCPECGKPFRT